MAISTYEKGDLVRVSATFTAGGVPADPTNIFCWKRAPSGAASSYQYGVDEELGRDDDGDYHFDIDASAIGTWYYGFYSTGTGQAADEGKFVVSPTQRP